MSKVFNLHIYRLHSRVRYSNRHSISSCFRKRFFSPNSRANAECFGEAYVRKRIKRHDNIHRNALQTFMWPCNGNGKAYQSFPIFGNNRILKLVFFHLQNTKECLLCELARAYTFGIGYKRPSLSFKLK